LENGDTAGLRLQVFLSHAGVASRRAAENLIAQGRVSVNGKIISAQGSKVYTGDAVLVDGNAVSVQQQHRYYALNKPAGFICSSYDPQSRPLALSLLPNEKNERLYSIGRLDLQSCGLVLFTNDGNFAAKLGHPATAPEKEYFVDASGPIPAAICQAFLQGITIDDIHYMAKEAELCGRKSVRIVLIEGKNREIRKVFSHFHLHPVRLCRIRIGPVSLGDMPEGSFRALDESEIEELTHGYSH